MYYILVLNPKKATDSEYLEEGMVVRYAHGEIIGLTILNASHLKEKGREAARIKLELWDIGPLSAGESFAERTIWLPGQDSNLQPTG